MPYLDPQTRREVGERGVATTQGELNYIFTQAAIEYIKLKGLRYSTINDVLGAMTGALLEFYRRIAVPYEAKKSEDNGDVYGELVQQHGLAEREPE